MELAPLLVPAVCDRRHARAAAARPVQVGLEAPVRRSASSHSFALRSSPMSAAISKLFMVAVCPELRGHLRRVRARACGAAPGALSRLSGAGRGAAGRGVLENARHRLAASRRQGRRVGRDAAVDINPVGTDRGCLSDQAAERACLGEDRLRTHRAARQGRRPRRRAGSIRRPCHRPALLGARPICLFPAAGLRLNSLAETHRGLFDVLLVLRRSCSCRSAAARTSMHDWHASRCPACLLHRDRPVAGHRGGIERIFRAACSSRRRRGNTIVCACCSSAPTTCCRRRSTKETRRSRARSTRSSAGGDEGKRRMGRDLSPAPNPTAASDRHRRRLSSTMRSQQLTPVDRSAARRRCGRRRCRVVRRSWPHSGRNARA